MGEKGIEEKMIGLVHKKLIKEMNLTYILSPVADYAIYKLEHDDMKVYWQDIMNEKYTIIIENINIG